MCIETITDIIEEGNYEHYPDLSITAQEAIEQSWNNDEISLYGRFDLGYNNSQIKMLEYNADTPTSLLEAAVAQWNWLQDTNRPDQFNSIHERLVERWKQIAGKLPVGTQMYFTSLDSDEDWGNVNYLVNCAMEAGVPSSIIGLDSIGFNGESFVDTDKNVISALFKLYPWEWIMTDEYAPHVAPSGCRFIEPAWKMLLSDKNILVALWDKFPNHSLLLPAFRKSKVVTIGEGNWVSKPALSREGSNVSIFNKDRVIEKSTEFHEGYDQNYIVQRQFQMPEFQGNYPVIGSWIIGEEAAGMGIREGSNSITTNKSRFVPHYFN
jgi:glutathionylspermidine synthase